jgi:hypothetical protein
MSSIENLKLGQWRKLFSMFKPNILQRLNILRTKKDNEFEVQNLEFFC